MLFYREFAHRRNADSSFDSICTRCFVTAASAENEWQLTALESAHICGALGNPVDEPRLGDRVRVRGHERPFFVMSVDDENQTANLVTASGTPRSVEAVPLGQLLLPSQRVP